MKAATLWAAIGILCLLTILATPARATLITFEDLDPYVWHWDERDLGDAWEQFQVNYMPLTHQYAHLGVSFGEGYPVDIASYPSVGNNLGAAILPDTRFAVSGNQAVHSWYQPGFFDFRFIGDDLPDYVSFHVSSVPGPMYARITQSNGVEQSINLGYEVEDGELTVFDPPPFKEKLEFHGEDIEEVHIGSFYGHRSTPVIMDDLYFGPSAPVPEPATIPLLLAGVMGLGLLVVRRL